VSKLEQSEDRWVTRMGAWFPGERVVFRGKDLHVDLGDASWWEVFAFGVTGHRFNRAEINLLNAMWVMTSYPDPRLWNNRVAALAGTTRSTGTLGIAAAIAVSDASLYGGRPIIRANDFLERAHTLDKDGGDLTQFIISELRQHRRIGGFGRPIVQEDERIKHIMDLADEAGLADGPRTRLVFKIEELLNKRRYRLKLNYAGLTAALCADMGFNPRQYYLVSSLCFVAGMPPCYIDALDHPEGTFFPLRCDRVKYEGVPPRRWDDDNI
jgi:citrate synthase